MVKEFIVGKWYKIKEGLTFSQIDDMKVPGWVGPMVDSFKSNPIQKCLGVTEIDEDYTCSRVKFSQCENESNSDGWNFNPDTFDEVSHEETTNKYKITKEEGINLMHELNYFMKKNPCATRREVDTFIEKMVDDKFGKNMDDPDWGDFDAVDF